MTPIAVAILGGCLLGAGVWLFTTLFVPHRVDLAAVLATPRDLPRTAAFLNPEPEGSHLLLGRWQRRLEVRLASTGLRSPDADLAVAGLTRGEFLLIRVAAGFAGLLIVPVYVLLFAAFDTGIPLAIPAVVGVGIAVLGWFVPGAVVQSRAEARRREMRYALVSYLTLVALHRAAGQGMTSALEMAAAGSESWTFQRIGAGIDSALRAGEAPWTGLSRLAADLGIDELSDLANIADIAATGGAGVYSTLLARARALRHELQTREEAAAAITSARLVIPKAILGILTLLFLLYPAVMSIGAS